MTVFDYKVCENDELIIIVKSVLLCVYIRWEVREICAQVQIGIQVFFLHENEMKIETQYETYLSLLECNMLWELSK